MDSRDLGAALPAGAMLGYGSHSPRFSGEAAKAAKAASTQGSLGFSGDSGRIGCIGGTNVCVDQRDDAPQNSIRHFMMSLRDESGVPADDCSQIRKLLLWMSLGLLWSTPKLHFGEQAQISPQRELGERSVA